MSFSISVCIPCVEIHIPLLDRCIKSISEQSKPPLEVVICISNIINMDDAKLKTENILKKYKLNFIVDYTSEKCYAGINRNKAVNLASGDIISFIDADDLMLKSRLYTITKVFELKSDCIGVLHYFIENKPLESKENAFDKNLIDNYYFTLLLHFGHSSFKKCIFNEFKFSNNSRCQDLEFIELLIPSYRYNLYIYKDPLSNYISNDSTLYGKR
jgi:glycosyltransferase involved in cell wall biosynthesis